MHDKALARANKHEESYLLAEGLSTANWLQLIKLFLPDVLQK